MDLQDIRRRINAVDDQLLPLFLERMELARQAGEAKAGQGLPVRNEAREQAILDRVAAQSGELAPYAQRLYWELFQLARDYEEASLAPKAGETREF